jgi:molybdopterin-containing oxidoreductase family iron-sulfur binding subunit
MSQMSPDPATIFGDVSRRDALRTLASGLALAVSGCGKPVREILPYVDMPERVLPGEILRFATTLSLGGFGRGALVHSVDGRPIKIEGNPLHPASLGATDVFAEAAIFDLYDPARSQTALRGSEIVAAVDVAARLQLQLQRAHDNGGDMRLLTGPITSPTLLRLIARWLDTHPGAHWHVHDPLDEPARREGAQIAFGRAVEVAPDLSQARAILSLGDDFLGPGPAQIRNAHDWRSARKAMNDVDATARLYVVEAGLTVTGAKADHRLTLHPHRFQDIAAAIAHDLGADVARPNLAERAASFVDACKADLSERRGVVAAGRSCNAETHALAHWINHAINAPVHAREPITGAPAAETLEALATALHAGAAGSVVVLDANPVYDAPPALRMDEAFRKAPFSLHVGVWTNETSQACQLHAPLSHELESWLDLRAPDGSASLVQPLIRPLYNTRSASEWLASLLGDTGADGYDLVRETWAATWNMQPQDAAFETRWRRALHDGWISDSAPAPATLDAPRMPQLRAREGELDGDKLTILLAPDNCLFDGSRATNAWLQECPKPLGAQVWGHALELAIEDAGRLGVSRGSVVRVDAGGRTIDVVATIAPDMADGVARLTLGYGREHAGAIGTGLGANAYHLRGAPGHWLVEGARVVTTGARAAIIETRNNVRIDGLQRDLFPVMTTEDLQAGKSARAKPTGPPASFFPDFSYEGHAWGMVIDTAACIGCNACVVSCQSENNVPVVGPEEIQRGRDMHWLRIDRYDHGGPERPHVGFQPVPCMQCEKAPCEPVCPVAASVHDSEGLNVQVYNRCVGTRFCQANCPYKVRHFNFYGYADGQTYKTLGSESLKAQHNPDVTVRARGVMEKCTYCVQRISRAKRDAQIASENMAPDAVKTACQSACPTDAIRFGDLNDERADVRALKRDPRHYALLEELDTRPRTTFLADVRNLNPKLGKDDA